MAMQESLAVIPIAGKEVEYDGITICTQLLELRPIDKKTFGKDYIPHFAARDLALAIDNRVPNNSIIALGSLIYNNVVITANIGWYNETIFN
jgi:hypothetical protein